MPDDLRTYAAKLRKQNDDRQRQATIRDQRRRLALLKGRLSRLHFGMVVRVLQPQHFSFFGHRSGGYGPDYVYEIRDKEPEFEC